MNKLKFLKIILLLFSIISCDPSTKPETVTFSGTVTLEGETDFSGVKVSLYKPVELDTALVRINQEYPQIGVQISQETEFDHREHTPLYSTTTNTSGAWEIKDVTPGTYNVVAEKDSFGWKVYYNKSPIFYNFKLTREIDLTKYNTNEILVPENSFISIDKSVVLSEQKVINIGNGTIMEFSNSGYLEINGKFTSNGTNLNNNIICSKDTFNTYKLKFGINSVAEIRYTIVKRISNGFYFTNSDSVDILHCRLSNGYRAIEAFNCLKFHLENSVITNMTEGLKLNNSKTKLFKNIILNIKESGLTSLNEQYSDWKNNVIKNCEKNGIAINPEGTSYSDTWVNITNNDLINNYDHIVLGHKAWCQANGNNFINEEKSILVTSRIISIDTLNFRNNFWNSSSPNEIDNKIIDLNDLDIGCIVDYQNFSSLYINWQ